MGDNVNQVETKDGAAKESVVDRAEQVLARLPERPAKTIDLPEAPKLNNAASLPPTPEVIEALNKLNVPPPDATLDPFDSTRVHTDSPTVIEVVEKIEPVRPRKAKRLPRPTEAVVAKKEERATKPSEPAQTSSALKNVSLDVGVKKDAWKGGVQVRYESGVPQFYRPIPTPEVTAVPFLPVNFYNELYQALKSEPTERREKLADKAEELHSYIATVKASVSSSDSSALLAAQSDISQALKMIARKADPGSKRLVEELRGSLNELVEFIHAKKVGGNGSQLSGMVRDKVNQELV